MTDQDQAAGTSEWLGRALATERERARRLRAATSLLSMAALGLVVSLSLPWATSADEHDPSFDPFKTLQLDMPGPWRADGWFILRDALSRWGEGGTLLSVLATAAPLVGAAVAVWALATERRTASSVARVVGAAGVMGLAVAGFRLLVGPGVVLGTGLWLGVLSFAALAWGGTVLHRALTSGG